MKWRIQIDLISEDTAIQANNMIDTARKVMKWRIQTEQFDLKKKVEKWSCTTT